MTAPTNNAFTAFLALESVLGASGQLERRMENDSNGKILYIGSSITPNGDVTEPIWMITKFEYDGNGFINRCQLPDNGNGFIYVWDNRATYFS